MNYKYIKLVETVDNLHNEIKMFEKERDITDLNRLNPLYELYYNAIDRLNNYKLM